MYTHKKHTFGLTYILIILRPLLQLKMCRTLQHYYCLILYYIIGRTFDSSAPSFSLLSACIWKRFQFSSRTLGHIHDGVDAMKSLILLLISCISLSLLLQTRCFNLTPEQKPNGIQSGESDVFPEALL